MHIVTAVCAGIVLLLGLLTLVEYVSGADFGIDQFLIRELTHLSGDFPVRMAVNTALSFSAVGAALLLLSLEHGGMVVAVHALAIVPIVLGGSALIGYGYDIEEFLREKANYTPMSIHAATVFVLFAFGLVSARADYPFRRFVTSGNPAGVMVRRLLPAATGFTLVAGWLILQGYHAGYFSETFALALFTAVSIAGLGVMILWNAGTLYDAAVQRERMEEALRENEERLNTIINILPVGLWVLSGEGSVVYSNPAAQRIWAGVRYVDIERLGEYKGWWLDSGKLVEPHEWAGARAVQKGETSTEEEIEIECFDGTHKIILDSAVPLRRSDGSIRGAVTVNQDITERKRAEEELRAASSYARSLIEASLDPLVTINAEGKVTDVNEAKVKATGVPREALVGSDFSDYFTEPDKARAGYREVFAKGSVTDYPLTLRHVSGKVMDVLYNASIYRNAKDEVAGVFAAARDITERKRAEEALRNVGAYNRSLIEVSLDSLVTISADGKITDVNEATVQATGTPRSLLIGSDFSDYFTEPDKARAGYQEVFAKGFVTDYPLSLRHVSGRAKDVLYNASVYRNAKGEVAGVFAAARDITERKKLERELERQARKDMLTGLNNRRHFFELAGQELARSRRHDEPLSLLMMDVDHFKAVNDTYGHHIGDAALQKLSEICLHTFREFDFVGRLGGEEFAALLPETNLEQALEVAERLRQAVENAAVKAEGGSLIHFTVSIGVVGIKATDARVETALRRADAALYKAKNSGRNRVCSEGTGGNNKVE